MRKSLSKLLLLIAIGRSAEANICGTDFQNFNPTTNGLDFITVQSSETLKPCIGNFGFFLNYAANSLSYSQNLPGSNILAGTKANDRTLGADISLGFGIKPNWDVGVNLAAIMSQELKDQVGVAVFEQRGLTEIKLNTKYRFFGDDNGGFAGIFSVNNNLIQNNPLAGAGAGPTFNFELAVDTTIKEWAMAFNAGYRKRNPGDPLAGQAFVPMTDQWIYSAAGSYFLPQYASKLILELFGSTSAHHVGNDTDRGLNALEWLGGLKHEYSHNLALHVGGGGTLSGSFGGPDWRIYTGINWTFGPVCSTAAYEKVESGDGKEKPDIYRFSAEILFDFDSDKIKSIHLVEIEKLIKELNEGGYKRLEIEGHTDSIGPAAYNLDLSRRRAASVKKYLVESYKAPADKIKTTGYGAERPIADNRNYQGRNRNRRVEIKVWK